MYQSIGQNNPSGFAMAGYANKIYIHILSINSRGGTYWYHIIYCSLPLVIWLSTHWHQISILLWNFTAALIRFPWEFASPKSWLPSLWYEEKNCVSHSVVPSNILTPELFCWLAVQVFIFTLERRPLFTMKVAVSSQLMSNSDSLTPQCSDKYIVPVLCLSQGYFVFINLTYFQSIIRRLSCNVSIIAESLVGNMSWIVSSLYSL